MAKTHDAAPAYGVAAVTKSDTTTVGCRALYVGGAGDVAIVSKEGDAAVTFSSVPAGAILPVYCHKVMSTNTTATNMVALY